MSPGCTAPAVVKLSARLSLSLLIKPGFHLFHSLISSIIDFGIFFTAHGIKLA